MDHVGLVFGKRVFQDGLFVLHAPDLDGDMEGQQQNGWQRENLHADTQDGDLLGEIERMANY